MGTFSAKKIGHKTGKITKFKQKNGHFKKIQNFLLEIFLILLPFQMDIYLTL